MLDQLRKAHKVIIAQDGFDKTTWYTAHLRNNIQLSFENRIESLLDNSIGNLVANVVNIVGYAPAFQSPTLFRFKGTEPYSFSLDTVLVLKENINTDFLDPITNLAKMCLGAKTKNSIGATWSNVESKLAGDKSNKELTAVVNKWAPNITKWLNDLYAIHVPTMFSDRLWVYIGDDTREVPMTIGPCVIKGVSFDFGAPIYEGKYPPVIGVNIRMVSAETPVADTVMALFKQRSSKDMTVKQTIPINHI